MALNLKCKKSIQKIFHAAMIPFAGIIIFCMMVTLSTRFIYIYDGDKMIVFKTYSGVEETDKFLYQNGIKVTSDDLVQRNKRSPFIEEIRITRAFPVRVTADGRTTTLMLRDGKVDSVLKMLNISLDGDDLINYDLAAKVHSGMNIVVQRVTYETKVEWEPIPYPVKQIRDPKLPAGRSVKVKDGANGVFERKTVNKYVDGKLVKSDLVYETVIKTPVEALVKYNAWATYTSRRGDTFRYSRVIEVTATAYTHGEGGTRTATGKKLKAGIVAVDPKVIPLGSRLYIESPSGKYVYGYAVAEDTGGAIKGLKIDLFFDTKQEVYDFGRRKMKVYVLTEGRQ